MTSKQLITKKVTSHTFIRFLLMILMASNLLACQDDVLKTKLDFRTKTGSGAESNPIYSFEQFLATEPETGSPESFTSDLFESQIALTANFQQTRDNLDGRCLMMLAATELPEDTPQETPTETPEETAEEATEETGPLTNLSALAQGEMQVSDSGMLLYSEPNQQSSNCLAVMSGMLEDQYETNIDSIYISFYRY